MFTFLSITGLVKTLLIIIGVIVVLRFFGRLASARKHMEIERRMNEQSRKFETDKRNQQKKFGKTEIINQNKAKDSIQDVDFEEVK